MKNTDDSTGDWGFILSVIVLVILYFFIPLVMLTNRINNVEAQLSKIEKIVG